MIFKQRSAASVAPQVIPVALPMGTLAASSPATFGDVETLESTGVETWNDWRLESPVAVTLANESPNSSIAGNVVSRVAGQFARVRVINEAASTRMRLGFDHQSSGTFREATGFVSGSHPDIALGSVQPTMVEGKGLSLFSTINHGSSTYVYNEDCFAAAFDFTGCPVWNSRSGNSQRGGAAITPRHLWVTHHFPLEVGDSVRFVTQGGEVASRTVIGKSFSASPGSAFNPNLAILDFSVIALSSALPAGVAVYSVCGEWARNIISIPGADMPSLNNSDFPGFYTSDSGVSRDALVVIKKNPANQISISAVASISDTAQWTINSKLFEGTTLPLRIPLISIGQCLPGFLSDFDALHQEWVTGDSGSPAFIPTGSGEMALLTLATTTSQGMFPAADALNACIVSANDHAVSLGHTRPTDYEVTVAPDPTL